MPGKVTVPISILPPLKQGDKGPAVNWLVFALKLSGWDTEGKLKPDGDFTPGGEISEALKYYQKQSELPETGDFDEATRTELEDDISQGMAGQFKFDELTVDMFVGETSTA